MAVGKHIIHDPAGPDVEFEGELVAEERGADIGNVKVFRTKSGKLVAEQRRSAFRGRHAIDRVGIFETLHDLSDWIGHSIGAKAVLKKLNHPTYKRVD